MQSEDTTVFYPAPSDCKKWFRIVNITVFDASLPPIKAFDIEQLKRLYGCFIYPVPPNMNALDKPKIVVHSKFKSEKFFVNVLGHELVHYWQWLEGYPVKHNESFHQWKPHFERFGMTLMRDHV
jgi:hypothetical protein